MKATNLNLQGVLNSANQYVIPVFQRFYSWGESDWKRLWEDIIEIQGPDHPTHSHFMGSLVFVPEKLYPDRVPAFQVIDGQQRLITLTLLLCALRDTAQKHGFDMLAAEITQTYLVHPFKKGSEYFRVYPRQRDRGDYMAAIDQKGLAAGRAGEALAYFTQQIATLPDATTEDGLRAFFDLLKASIDLVTITLEGENPYRIFKSLNSTGVDLSEADLIRNFIFMHVPIADQDAFDDSYWVPLEKHFEKSDKSLDGNALSAFFRDYLMRTGRYVPPAGTFQAFETRYHNGFVPVDLVQELARCAISYDKIRGLLQHPDSHANNALRKLRQLESSTAYPLVLNLMERVETGTMSITDLVQAVELLSGFILRRFVCGESSRAYGRLFVAVCNELGDDALAGLRTSLAKRGFPDDTRFTTTLIRFPLYGSRYTRSILETLERYHEHKEPADLTLAQIEHIMPQTLSNEWLVDLGPDAPAIHAAWLHTLGNLTLSAYNPELQNHAFRVKREEYKNSNIIMTRRLAERTTWDAQAIEERGQRLAELAAKVWVGPDA